MKIFRPLLNIALGVAAGTLAYRLMKDYDADQPVYVQPAPETDAEPDAAPDTEAAAPAESEAPAQPAPQTGED